MLSKIYSATILGLSPQLIEIETAVNKGLRSFNIVGLADKSIEESKERIGMAIKSINLSPPHRQSQKVVVNLVPADLKKEGTFFDLAIALGYLLSSGQTKFNPEGKIIIGELTLDGTLKPIKGALSFAFLAKELGFKEIILPKENAAEAALVNSENREDLLPQEVKVIGVSNLKEAIAYLEGRREMESFKLNLENLLNEKQNFEIDVSWIKGQNYAKRALEISAAGGHNLLMQGPPGTGKTLLAKSMISILPKLSFEESLELTKIYSGVGLFQNKLLITRPFRNPHHSSSETAILGGGNPLKIGEITLAHRGVLFLDEFPEFHRDVLESLRQPMEEGKITISRSKYSFTFPSQFSLIASANPCPCGFLNDPERECVCTNSQIGSYRRKLSGPIIDRIDIFIDVPSLKYKELISPDNENQTDEIRKRVEKARKIQRERFKNEGILTNSEMKVPQIKKYCSIPPAAKGILEKYVNSSKLSARGYHRVLKVATTIADLEGKQNISLENISEALIYRLREKD